MKMEMKHIIVGILILVGIFFVGSEYGLFQQLTLATTSDSPELVYDTYPFKEDIDLDMQCICVTGQVYSNCISDNLCCYGHSRWDFSLNYEYLYKIDFEVDEKDNKLSVITGRDDVYHAQLIRECVLTGLRSCTCAYSERLQYSKIHNYVASDTRSCECYVDGSDYTERIVNPELEAFLVSDILIPNKDTPYITDLATCTLGIETTDDGLKCIGYCEPSKSVCIGDIEQRCTDDGSEVIKTSCVYGCKDGACIVPNLQINLGLEEAGYYRYGEDAPVYASILANDEPYVNRLVTGKLMKDGGVISETTSYTDNAGNAKLVFENVYETGLIQVEVSSVYYGVKYTETRDIYFEGESVIFSPGTYSEFQYTTGDVQFNVNIKDGAGRDITPADGDLTILSTMTNDNLVSSRYEHLGEGNYLITSVIKGPGIYNGRVGMVYRGVNFESKGVEITVREVELEVGTSSIIPSAKKDSTENIQFSVSTSLGDAIDPDAIKVIVTYPSGYVTDEFVMSQMIRVEEGVYEFDYTFTDVEKYSFDIYVDKENYVLGHAKATVAVAGPVDPKKDWLAWIISNTKTMFIILIVIGSVYAIYKKRR